MKLLLSIIAPILIFVGCQTEKSSPVKKESKKIVEADSNLVPEIVTTAEPMICAYLGGPPFDLDTMIKVDTLQIEKEDESRTVYLRFTAYFPQSNLERHQHLNNTVRDFINKYYQEHNLTESPMNIDADIWVSDYSWNGDVVSFVFTEQDYYHGAAHYNHGYLSLNYDLKKNKEIKLTDLVLFKNGEAQKFCDAFNPDPTTTIHEIFLEGKDFTKDRPFTVNYGELVLYFSDAEKSPSMEKIYIPYSKIKGYIHPDYKMLFTE